MLIQTQKGKRNFKTIPPIEPPITTRANPSALPLAGNPGPTPGAGTYGRNLASGDTYNDPYSGVTILKVTDTTHPSAGNDENGAGHGYSSGGPRHSQPWQSGGETYYTLFIENGPNPSGDNGAWLVDLKYSDLTLSNWRQFPPAPAETGFAFSLNPNTPRIAYVQTGAKQMSRYDTAAMAVANTGNWPWNIAGTGDTVAWVTTQLNDVYVGIQLNNTDRRVCIFNPANGAEISKNNADLQVLLATAAIDEYHLDKEFGWVYFSSGPAETNEIRWNLSTNVLSILNDPNLEVMRSHSDSIRGAHIGCVRSFLGGGFHRYNVLTDTVTRVVASADGWHSSSSEWYHCGNWIMNMRDDPWVVGDRWQADDTNAKLRAGMIGWINVNTGEVRILCSHDNVAPTTADYQRFTQTTCTPDGKLVIWTSDMNRASGTATTRKDVFVAKMPVS